jgi:hypothetical protein
VANRPRRIAALLVDGTVVVLLLAILGLPLAATVAAAGAGIAPTAPESTLPPLGNVGDSDAPPLRDLPVLTAGGEAERAIGDGRSFSRAAVRTELERAAGRAFGGADTTQFWDVLALSDLGIDYYAPAEIVAGKSIVPYPYRYPYLDALLDQMLPPPLSRSQAEAANDLAGLLLVAAASFTREEIPALLHAGPGAFSLLQRARMVGPSCDVALNLAFVVATDISAADDVVTAEFDVRWQRARRTRRHCGCWARSASSRATWYRDRRARHSRRRPRRSSHGRSRRSVSCSGHSRDQPPVGPARPTPNSGWPRTQPRPGSSHSRRATGSTER